MMVDFFGTTPGLLSLAGLAAVLILVSLLKRLAARARARREQAPASPAGGPLPRWAVAAIAAWAAVEAREGPERGAPTSSGSVSPVSPSAAAWRPSAGGPDPWLAWAGPERRNVGVTK
jgi:hypothetical protein